MLITEQYKELLAELHREKPEWGTSAQNNASLIRGLIGDFGPLNVLDYGCGKQTLGLSLPQYRIKGYDPALPGLDAVPEPHDMVICMDVLEHIEPECLGDVLNDLQRVTRKNLFVQVCTARAVQELPDGRNAHLIVENARWWINKLWDRFYIISFAVTEYGFNALFGAMDPKGNGTK